MSEMGNFLGTVDKDLIKGSFFVKLCEMRMLFGGKYTKNFVDNILSKEGFFDKDNNAETLDKSRVPDDLVYDKKTKKIEV
jgi:hypothetical protein